MRTTFKIFELICWRLKSFSPSAIETLFSRPGFINFRVHPSAKQHTAKTILVQGERYGRSDSAGGPFTSIATNVGTPSYTDTKATNGSTYFYAVTAVNRAGLQSAQSAPASIAIHPAPGVIDAESRITFENVPPGRYVLRGRPNPSSADERTEPVTVDLKGGQRTEVTLRAR